MDCRKSYTRKYIFVSSPKYTFLASRSYFNKGPPPPLKNLSVLVTFCYDSYCDRYNASSFYANNLTKNSECFALYQRVAELQSGGWCFVELPLCMTVIAATRCSPCTKIKIYLANTMGPSGVHSSSGVASTHTKLEKNKVNIPLDK